MGTLRQICYDVIITACCLDAIRRIVRLSERRVLWVRPASTSCCDGSFIFNIWIFISVNMILNWKCSLAMDAIFRWISWVVNWFVWSSLKSKIVSWRWPNRSPSGVVSRWVIGMMGNGKRVVLWSFFGLFKILGDEFKMKTNQFLYHSCSPRGAFPSHLPGCTKIFILTNPSILVSHFEMSTSSGVHGYVVEGFTFANSWFAHLTSAFFELIPQWLDCMSAPRWLDTACIKL